MLVFLCVFGWEKNCSLLLKMQKTCWKICLSLILLLWTNIWRKISHENMIFSKTFGSWMRKCSCRPILDCQMVLCKLNTNSLLSLTHIKSTSLCAKSADFDKIRPFISEKKKSVLRTQCSKSNSGLCTSFPLEILKMTSLYRVTSHYTIKYPSSALYIHHAIKH